jgi:hypothetical protein
MPTKPASEVLPQAGEAPRRITKREQILALFIGGVTDLEAIADITGSRSSYVASVLQNERLLTGYFDLYTTSAEPMNVYSRLFSGQLGFRDLEAAQQSVALLDRYYREFERAGDRAGQHHALMMALTMFDRARWINKMREADVFRQWLLDQLTELDDGAPQAQSGKRPVARKPPKK